MAKSDLAKGIAIGVVAAAAVPLLLPAALVAARPLARAAVKTGLIAYEKGREAMAEVSEVVEDLVAEARAELDREETLGGESLDEVVAAAASQSAQDNSADNTG